jgi:hypothetical protein
MNAKTIREYKEIISGHFTRATTDKEALAKLAEFSSQLRVSIQDIVRQIVVNPEDPLLHAYLGAAFYAAIKTTDLRFIKRLAVPSTSADNAIERIRAAGILQISAEAQKAALWLKDSYPELLWITIQLTLLHSPEQSWASTAVCKDEIEEQVDKDDKDDKEEKDDDNEE